MNKILCCALGAAPCEEALQPQAALALCGLQPVPADDLGPFPQLQLEDLGALLQYQVWAHIVVP